MPEETTLQKSYRQSKLWPPIYAALEVFLRRRAARAEPYELTWRLIHVWECVVLTLVQAAISKLMDEKDKREEELRVIREKCYGVAWEGSDATIKKRTGAFDGSMDKWIEILEYLSTINVRESSYLMALKHFLNGKSENEEQGSIQSIDLAHFAAAWARACDVPSGFNQEKVLVKNSFKVVNCFRNRLAHVPFPYDPMSDIYRGLEWCTEQLFSAEPKPTGPEGAMSGCIGYRGQVIKGSAPCPSSVVGDMDGPEFIFEFKDAGSYKEKWSARLFIHIDNMLRPYILTRLKDDAGLWEYTRYLAESNAVVTIQKPTYLEHLPIPSEREYLTEREDEPLLDDIHPVVDDGQRIPKIETEELKVESMCDATRAIQTRRFAPAIEFLEQQLEERPNYHVGWLRLGHAKRELAVDLLHIQSASRDDEADARVRQLLESSLGDFTKAEGHISAPYRAEAHYHASKSYLRLWQYFKDESFRERARHEADEAAKLYPDSKYDSWIEFLWNACEPVVYQV